MSDADRLRRLARAQRALAEVAAARHAMAVRAHADKEAEADAILASLNSDSPLHGLLVATMATALTRNGRQVVRLRREVGLLAAASHREDVAAKVLDERTRLAVKRAAVAAERKTIEEIGATWHLRRR